MASRVITNPKRAHTTRTGRHSGRIASMFHTRLAILLLAVLLGLGLLVSQALRLTSVRHAEALEVAESKLVRTTWLNTTRGRILDRKGRVLAHDRPGYAVAVEYDVITGAWSEAQAGRAARRLHAEQWPKLATEQREEIVARYRPIFDAHLDAMWASIADISGTPRSDVDARRERIVERVSGRFAHIVDVRLRVELERRLRLGQEITEELEDRLLEKASRPIREQTDAHVIVPDITDEVGFRFRRMMEQRVALVPGFEPVRRLPGLSVPDLGRREYPFGSIGVQLETASLPAPLRTKEPKWVQVTGLASQLLGWTRSRLYREDVERRVAAIASDTSLEPAITRVGSREIDRGRYAPGDRIGTSGLEESFEDRLRGWRGLEILRLDTGETRTVDPNPGRDITLTIDAMLQARIQALFDPSVGLARVQPWHDNDYVPVGTDLYGAAVVLDIDSGEILAMVSVPTFTPEQLDEPRVLEDPIRRPLTNRAVESPYPPGSIVKVFMLPEAVKRGLATPDHRHECTGYLLPNKPESYRCWIYKRFSMFHRPEDPSQDGLAVDEAIKGSCNIYFYDLGRTLGPEAITQVYQDFHVDVPWQLPLANAFAGSLGRPEANGELEPNEAIFMGMGQGPVAWTPLHAANAYATLARGGTAIEPSIIRDTPPQSSRLDLDPVSLKRSLHGLWRVVNDTDGTAYGLRTEAGREKIFNAPGLAVWGKTGTADAPPLVENARVLRDGDHSWFVALVGEQTEDPTPRYAIAVVTEYGGSGGRVSGPIANQIMHALQAEGYLAMPTTEAPGAPG